MRAPCGGHRNLSVVSPAYTNMRTFGANYLK